MNPKEPARRRFLKQGAALAGLATVGAGSVAAQTDTPQPGALAPGDRRLYGQRSRFEKSRRNPTHTPFQDSVGIITPAPLHFVNNHGYNPPDIDPAQHRLLIHGMVDRPLIFTLDELKRLPSVSRIHFVECAGNTAEGRDAESIQESHGFMSCSEWSGVLLSTLLEEAGVQKSGTWIVAEGADAPNHSKSIPMDKAMEDVFVAYGQNGEAVRPEQGYPMRLIVPGWEGINHVKWLRRIKVVDEPYMARMESVLYVTLWPKMKGKGRWFNFEMGPKSVITKPCAPQKLNGPGAYEISGLAWSGGGLIRRVDVSTDGGKTWQEARLEEPLHRIAHSRFRFPWTWNGEETVIMSRSTDERGQIQPTLDEIGKMWGVDGQFFKTTETRVNHWNAIHPWRVTRDGSVHNAVFG